METTDKRRATRDNYDRLSSWYDLFSGSERRFTSQGIKLLELQPGEQVLEIGFGTGYALVEMACQVTASGRVCGIDLSPGMLAMASKRVQRSGTAETVSLQTGDATRLPFPDGTFQAVFMSFTLELFPEAEIPVVLAECRRVLQPGGRLGVVTLVKEDSFAVRVYEWFHTHMPALVDCRPIQPGKALTEAGFSLAKEKIRSLWGLPVGILKASRN